MSIESLGKVVATIIGGIVLIIFMMGVSEGLDSGQRSRTRAPTRQPSTSALVRKNSATPTETLPLSTAALQPITPVKADSAQSTVNQTAVVCGKPCSCSPVMRTITRGTQVAVFETTSCGGDIWYRIGESEWLGPHLIEDSLPGMASFTTAANAPTSTPLELPTAIPTPTFTPAPPTPTPKPPTPIPTTRGCADGCIDYPSWCAPPIKGNVSYNTGERIYHVPGQAYYDETVINSAYGERWFCTEQEARAAGWRKSYR